MRKNRGSVCVCETERERERETERGGGTKVKGSGEKPREERRHGVGGVDLREHMLISGVRMP